MKRLKVALITKARACSPFIFAGYVSSAPTFSYELSKRKVSS